MLTPSYIDYPVYRRSIPTVTFRYEGFEALHLLEQEIFTAQKRGGTPVLFDNNWGDCRNRALDLFLFLQVQGSDRIISTSHPQKHGEVLAPREELGHPGILEYAAPRDLARAPGFVLPLRKYTSSDTLCLIRPKGFSMLHTGLLCRHRFA